MATPRRIAVVLAATALSAGLFYAGTGLVPVAWCTWLAPLPVLLLAPRVAWWTAFAAGAIAWLGGETEMWGYFTETLQLPLVPAIALVGGSAIFYGLVVVLFRALVRRGRPLLAACSLPAAWVAVEYTMSLAGPFGAWWSLAYTQADVLPVLQIASLTGRWGITFLLLALPAALAAIITRRDARVAVAAAVIAAVVLGYGGWRLNQTEPSLTAGPKIVGLAAAQPDPPIDVATPMGTDLLTRYTSLLQSPATEGARVVVLPEKAFTADDHSLPLLAHPLAAIATRLRLDIIAGLVMKRGGTSSNEAIDFPAGGGTPVRYDKHHLIPGLEDDLEPGHEMAFVPGSGNRWAIAICYDLDFPTLVRGYRDRGATAVFVPAWDFDRDAWLHSRKAILNSVEYGVTILRTARNGALTLSDPAGRVRTEARTRGRPSALVTATLPNPADPTPYARFGDWFAWACLALLLPAMVLARGRVDLGTPRDTGDGRTVPTLAGRKS